jgi:hypothetical protein
MLPDMKRRTLLLRIGAVVLSVGLGASYVAYRALAGGADASPGPGPSDAAAEQEQAPPPSRPATLPGSKSAAIIDWAPEPKPPQPLMHTTKRGVIVTPADVEPPAPDPLKQPDRLGPP